jgi:hypothetical protein
LSGRGEDKLFSTTPYTLRRTPYKAEEGYPLLTEKGQFFAEGNNQSTKVMTLCAMRSQVNQ